MNNNLVETLIGAVVIAIAVVFFTYAYKTADVGKGSDGYTLTAQFERVDGCPRAPMSGWRGSRSAP